MVRCLTPVAPYKPHTYIKPISWRQRCHTMCMCGVSVNVWGTFLIFYNYWDNILVHEVSMSGFKSGRKPCTTTRWQVGTSGILHECCDRCWYLHRSNVVSTTSSVPHANHYLTNVIYQIYILCCCCSLCDLCRTCCALLTSIFIIHWWLCAQYFLLYTINSNGHILSITCITFALCLRLFFPGCRYRCVYLY